MSERVPRLRFKQEDDSAFPDWRTGFLGEACEIKTGDKDTQNRVDEGKYPFFVRSNTVERINSYSFDGEAILTSGDGVGVGKNFHYINGKFDFHQRVYCLRRFRHGYSGLFVFYVFSEKFYKRVIRLSAKNSVDSVRMEMISKMEVDFPDLPEQQKIALFLSAVDEKIGHLERRLELLQAYKRGVMQKLFSREVRFKREDGSAFTDWIHTSIAKLAEVNPKGIALPKSFLYIDLESVKNGVLSDVKQISVSDAPSRAQRLLEQGDILFQTVRPYQKNNLFFDLHGEYVASTGYAQIRAKNNRMFLYQLLHTDNFVNDVLARCTGTSYPAINSSDLADIPICIPQSEVEQQKIAAFLSTLDTKLDAVSTQISQMQRFKKGLLQQMFV